MHNNEIQHSWAPAPEQLPTILARACNVSLPLLLADNTLLAADRRANAERLAADMKRKNVQEQYEKNAAKSAAVVIRPSAAEVR